MITIHQAIYGDKRNEHALLRASDPASKLYESLSGHTDPVDRPNGGLNEPVIRGFVTNKHFMLVKNFADTSDVRAGRVFAHAFFVTQEDFQKLSDICSLFQYFIPETDRNAEMTPIEHDENQITNSTDLNHEKIIAPTNALIKNEEFEHTIVWSAQNEYWQWISAIWARLPSETKNTLRLGAAFNPSKIKEDKLNLVYIPPELIPSWSTYPFKLVGETSEEYENEVVKWLLGLSSNLLGEILNDFKPKIETIGDLVQLEKTGKVYQQLSNEGGIIPKLVFADQISRKIPDSKKGNRGKEKLLNSIIDSIPALKESEITPLQFQTWAGFPDAIPRVSEALRNWLNTNLLSVSKDFISAFAKADKKNWWYKVARDCLDEKLSKWITTYAKTVWNWIMEKGNIPVIGELLPRTAEMDLVSAAQKSTSEIPKDLLKMCSEKNWLKLHAVMAGKVLKSEEAIRQQLVLDHTVSDSDAMVILAKEMGAKKFIDASVRMAEPKLYSTSAQLIFEKPDLKAGLDLASEPSQVIWLQSIELGSRVWQGIKEPQKKLFQVVESVLNEETFNEQLLLKMSSSDCNSLRTYQQRSQIWSHLRENTRVNFQMATLMDCLSHGEPYSNLEAKLIAVLNATDVLNTIIDDKSIPTQAKLNLFQNDKRLTEYHALRLVEGSTFGGSESVQIGKLAFSRKWKEVAKLLFDKRYDPILQLALAECSGLLGFWKRIQLPSSSSSKVLISSQEWWESFYTVATNLYQRGPDENGLWINSGGSLAQFSKNVTPKQAWTEAIQIIRKGGHPSIVILLDNMLQDYPNNSKLQYLRNTAL